MRSEQVGTLAILGSAVAYGLVAVLVKLALEAGAEPLSIVAWRFVTAAGAVWLFVAVGRRPLPPGRVRGWLAALGTIYAVNAIAFTFALQWVPASTASLVFYTYPILVVLLAALFLGEGLTVRRLAAMVVAVLGCALTAGVGARGGHPLGIALVLLSSLSLSLYIVLGRSVLGRLPTRGSAAMILTATGAVAAAAALVNGDWRLGGGARAAVLVLLMAVLSTAVALTLFVFGLKRVDAGRAAILSTIEPVVTITAAGLLLGERIAGVQYLGGALILSGVVWLRLERPLPPSEAPAPLEAP